MGDFADLLRRLRLDITGLSNGLRRVLDAAIVGGKEVEATMLSGTSSVVVKHGLGRAARGAVVVSSSSAVVLVASPVTTFDSITIASSGSVGSDVLIKAWVY